MSNIRYLLIAVFVLFYTGALAQYVNPNAAVLNSYASVVDFPECSPCLGNCNRVTVDNTTGFKVTDRVLLIQMKGADINWTDDASFGEIINYGSSGFHELLQIKSITGNTVEFDSPIEGIYDVNGIVQIVRIVEIKGDYTVPADGITCSFWNGRKGGVLFLEVDGTLTLNGDIDVRGRGFRGAKNSNTNIDIVYCGTGLQENGVTSWSNGLYTIDVKNMQFSGRKGEGIAEFRNPQNELGLGPLASGGGGGCNHNAGGGGGSNMGAGGNGGHEYDYISRKCGYDLRGRGGKVLDRMGGLRLFMGGGGGAGHENNNVGTSGGSGGGIIIIKAAKIEGNGHKIIADGTRGPRYIVDKTTGLITDSSSYKGGNDGCGGGGAGGAIKLECDNFGTGNLVIQARGSDGGDMNNVKHGPGGGGGGGLVCFTTRYENTAGISIVSDGGVAGVTNEKLTDGTYSTWGAEKGGNGLTAFECSSVSSAPPRSLSVYIGPDMHLCNPPSATLDTRQTEPLYTYNWYRNGVKIPGAASPTYTAAEAGEYAVELLSPKCPPAFDTVVLTKQGNETPLDAVFCNEDGPQKVTLGIANPSASAKYGWFETPQNGAPVFVGTLFETPALNATKVYYVTDTVSVQTVLRKNILPSLVPVWDVRSATSADITLAEHTNTFFVELPIILKSVQVMGNQDACPSSTTVVLYENGVATTQKATLKVTCNTLTTIPLNFNLVPNVTYSLRIDGIKAGAYKMLENTPAGESVPNVITVKPNYKTSGPFFNWNISYGAPCGRMPVTATMYCEPCKKPKPLQLTFSDTKDYLCEGETGTITTNEQYDATSYEYIWYNKADTAGNSFLKESGKLLSSLAVDYAKVGTYTVLVRDKAKWDDKSCWTSASISIDGHKLPTYTISGTQSVCEYETVSPLTVSLTGETPWEFELTELGKQVSSAATFTQDNPAMGTYQMVALKDQFCTGNLVPAQSAVVTIKPRPGKPVVDKPLQSIYKGQKVPEFTATGSTLVWKNEDYTKTLATGTSYTQTVTDVGRYVYNIVNNLAGCSDTAQAVLEISNCPSPVPVPDSRVYCYGETATPEVFATPNGSGTLYWFDQLAFTKESALTSGNKLVTSKTAPGIYTYYVSEFDPLEVCFGPYREVKLTIAKAPDASVSIAPLLCSDAAKAEITVTPIGGTLASADAGGALSGTGTVADPYLFDPYFAGFVSKSYTVSYAYSAVVDATSGKTCDTVVSTSTKVQATPKVPIFAPTTILTTSDVPKFSASEPNLKWYYDGAVTATQTYYPYQLKGQVGKYMFGVTQTIYGCESEPEYAELNIIECSAKLPTVVNVQRCVGYTDVPELLVTSGGTVTWFSDASTNNVYKLADGASFKPADTKTGSYNYYVAEYDADHSCWGPIATAMFEVSALPAVSITGPATLCYDAGKAEIVTEPGSVGTFVQGGGMTGNYFYPDAFGKKSDSHRLVYEYTHNITGCVNRDTLDIQVNYTPSPAVTDGGGLTIAIPSADPLKATGTSIKWYAGDLSPIVSANGLTEYKPSQTLAGNYPHFATQTINGCESEKAQANYTLSDCPAPRPLVESNSICDYQPLTAFTAVKGEWKAPQEGDAEFRWYDKQTGTMVAGASFTPDASYAGKEGVYQFAVLEYDLFKGCAGPEKTFSLTIQKQKPPVISVADDKLCIYESTAQLFASTYEGTVNWYSDALLTIPAGTGSSIAPSFASAGTFTYYATDAVQCTSSPTSVSFTVYDRPALPIMAASENCAGDAVAPMTATGTGVRWYSDAKLYLGATGVSYASAKTDIGTHDYFATQTSAEGCESNFAPVSYTVHALPATLIGKNDKMCQHWPMRTLSVNATESVVEWRDNLGNAYSGSSITPTALTQPADYKFTVTQTDAKGCKSLPATLTLAIFQRPLAPAAADESACEGAAAKTLKATGEQKAVFNWFSANDTASAKLSSINSIQATQTASGTYPYYVAQINTDGCVSPIKVVQYKVNKTPAAPAVASLWSCENSSIKTFEATHSADYVNWYLGTSTLTKVGSATDLYQPDGSLLVPGTATIFNAIAYLGSCPSQPATFSYTLRPQPQVPFVGKALICKGEANPSLIVLAETDSVQWVDSAQNIVEDLSQEYLPTDTAAGKYYYLVSQTVNGCTSEQDTLHFQIAPQPDIAISGDSLGCFPTRRNLYSIVNPNVNNHYKWHSTGSLELYNPVTTNDWSMQVDFTSMLLDTISVVAEDKESGCTAIAIVPVRVAPKPRPDFNYTVYNGIYTIDFQNITEQDPLIDGSTYITVPVHFLWDFGHDNDTLVAQPYFTLVKNDTVYYQNDIVSTKYLYGDYDVQLIAVNDYGCRDSITKTVHMEVVTGFYMPTAFCPVHGSDKLQEFRPFGYNIETLELSVYDSWGNLLWYSNKVTPDGQPAEAWTGVDKNGNPMPADVYMWKAKVKFRNGQEWEGLPMENGKNRIYGNVMLLR